MFRSRVAGIGSYLPEKVITNEELEKMVDTNDQWIVERTGIRRRHKAADNEFTSDIAYKAAVQALNEAEITAKEIDLIIFATVSGDHVMPNTACILQNKLGAPQCMAFDLSAACSGFVYSISIADQFIRTGMYKNILIVGAEVLHNIVDYTDRETCILFGDGAGAWVISRAGAKEENIILSSHLHADGGIGDLFVLPGGGSKIPFSQQVLDERLNYVKMNGRAIFKHAVRTLTACSQEALDANNMSGEQVDWLVPHQANIRILESVGKYFGIPMEKVICTLEETGNTSAASIPIAFDIAVKQGKIKRGQTVLLAAFGAGITSGSVLLKY